MKNLIRKIALMVMVLSVTMLNGKAVNISYWYSTDTSSLDKVYLTDAVFFSSVPIVTKVFCLSDWAAYDGDIEAEEDELAALRVKSATAMMYAINK